MPDLSLLASALLLGLLGSGHCLGMCGGLMGALSLSIPAAQQNRRSSLLIAYNLGRISSYALIGLIVGGLGWALSSNGTSFLRLLAAVLLISMGFYLAGWWSALPYIERLGQGLWRYLQPVARRLMPLSSLPRAFLAGCLWGWLPCGLVYSTLLWAAAQGNAGHALLLMLAFGLGTCPLLLTTGMAAGQLQRWLQQQPVRWASGVLIILFGLWSLLAPYQPWLMGHTG